MQTYEGTVITAPLPTSVREGLQQLGQQENATTFMMMLAGYYLLINRYTGAEDIPIGTPIANRRYAQTEPLISTLVNTLVLRTAVSPTSPSANSCSRSKGRPGSIRPPGCAVRAVGGSFTGQARHQPFPLFQLFFNVQNAPFSLPQLPGIEQEVIIVDRGRPSSTSR